MSQAERLAEAKAWRLQAQAVRVALRGSDASPHAPSLWVAGLQQRVTSGLTVFLTAGASCGAAGTHGPAPLCPLPFPSQALGLPIIRLRWAVQMWSWQPQHRLPWRQLLGKGPQRVRGTLAWRERLSANIPTSASPALRTHRPQPHRQRETRPGEAGACSRAAGTWVGRRASSQAAGLSSFSEERPRCETLGKNATPLAGSLTLSQ